MTGWLVFALVALFVAGSVLFILPTAGDKRRMELRQHAIQQGMGVSIRKLEIPGQPAAMMPVYQLRPARKPDSSKQLQTWQLFRSGSAFLDPFRSGWSWQHQPERIPPGLEQALSDLPDGVLSLARTRDGLQFYWNERDGDLAIVDRLLSLGARILDQESAGSWRHIS